MTAFYIVLGIVGLFVYLQIGYNLGYLYRWVYAREERTTLTWLLFPFSAYDNNNRDSDHLAHSAGMSDQGYRIYKAITWPMGIIVFTILGLIFIAAFAVFAVFIGFAGRALYQVLRALIAIPGDWLHRRFSKPESEQEANSVEDEQLRHEPRPMRC